MPSNEEINTIIRDNWKFKSLEEIALLCGLSVLTVRRRGARLNLGRKPKVYRKAKINRVNAGELSGGAVKQPSETHNSTSEPPTFFDMLDKVYFDLVQQREDKLMEIRVLETLPEDEDNTVKRRIESIKMVLYPLEQMLLTAEEIYREADNYRPNETGDITTFDDMIDYLDSRAARKSEGVLMEKVKMGADNLRREWQGSYKYDDGKYDCVLLCSESMVEDEQSP